MAKRVGVSVALLLSAVLLGGCVAFTSFTSEQADIVGKLRLTLGICKVDLASFFGQDHPGCDIPTNGGETLVNDGHAQVLLGFRVPVGTGAASSASGTTNAAPSDVINFERSAEYEAELTRLLPPAAGKMWIGYLSDDYSYAGGADGTPARQASSVVEFELPRPQDGGPFVGPLQMRPVVGARAVTAEQSANRPVSCGSSPFQVTDESTICVDNPLDEQINSEFNFQTRDFGVLAGKATASPGQTVSLPFNVRGAGALPAGLTAALSASTTLPGAGAVTPSVGSAALSNGSDTRVTVPVTIPKNAGPGVFDVSVTGRLDNGQTRTGVAKLAVRDRQKPVLTKAKAKPKRFKAATRRKPKRGTNVTFTLSEAASVRLTAERCAKRKRGRCVRWKALKGGLTKAGVKGANKVRFNGRLRGKALAAGAYRLALKPTDAAGNVGKVVRATIVIRG